MAKKKSKFQKYLGSNGQPSMEERERLAESICPSCGIEVFDHKCRPCGATKSVNSVSGNVFWMRNGRIVQGGAFKDEREAYTKMATQYKIPQERWPEKFRD